MDDFGQKIIKIRVAKNAEKSYSNKLEVKSALSEVIQLKQGLKHNNLKDNKKWIKSFRGYPIKTRIETLTRIIHHLPKHIFQRLSN